MVYAFLAEGFEETEAIAVIDIIKRGGIDLCTVSIKDDKIVKGSHGVSIEADMSISQIDFEKADMLFLPGGMPGTLNLADCNMLTEQIKKFASTGKKLAAICAAPSVLGQLGVLEGKKAICYPGFEGKLTGAQITNEKVVKDGNVFTSKGMGTAIDLGLEIVAEYKGRGKADEVAESIQYM